MGHIKAVILILFAVIILLPFYTYAYSSPPLPQYSAGSVLIMDVDTGIVLYEHAQHTLRYPASITKMMTVLLILEEIQDLSEKIPVSYHAARSLPDYASSMDLDYGDSISFYDALFGLMLPSANDAAIAVAEHISGSVENFVVLMNQRAASLGAVNTQFINACGMPGPGQTITAYDAAIIMRELITHPLFIEIIASPFHYTAPTASLPYGQRIVSTNNTIHINNVHHYEYIIGGKTGFTRAAGFNLVAYAYRDGRSLITVVLFTPNRNYSFIDTIALLEYGFTIPFTDRLNISMDMCIGGLPVFQEIHGELIEIGQVTLLADDDVYLYSPLPANFDVSRTHYEFNIPPVLHTPVLENELLGYAIFYVRDIRIGYMALRANNSVFYYIPYIPEPELEPEPEPETVQEPESIPIIRIIYTILIFASAAGIIAMVIVIIVLRR